LDEIRVKLAKAHADIVLSDSHDDTLVLRQIQRLQGLEYAILVHGINLHGHTPYCMPFAGSRSARFIAGLQDTAHLL
jgi:hypothetical protein